MKILLLDVETAPNTSYIWGLWQEVRSTSFITNDWFIMCWCAKWLGESKVMSASIHKSKSYKKSPECDKEIMIKFRDLLDEADVVVAHNGVKFDCKKIRTRFIINGIKPPSPYKVVDTLLQARKFFAFTSNRLDDLGKFLKVGEKMDTGGFGLWKDCLNGVVSAWNKMVKYCKQDVLLLERVYLKIRPYMVQHPNVGLYADDIRPCCPKCGSAAIHYRGYAYTNVSIFKRFSCQDCGAWGRERQNIVDKDKRKLLTTSIS